MSDLNHRKAFALNLVSQMINLGTQIVISFLLTPFVLGSLGNEAYGFVGLVNNFVSYLAVITTALNSLAGRYITISYHKGKTDESGEYYSSVFFANCFLAFVAIAASFLLMANIDKVVNVSDFLIGDLRLLVLLAFSNTAVSLLSVVFGVAAFICNKLYLNSLAQLSGQLVRTGLLCILFAFCPPHMWYYGVAGIASALIVLVIEFRVTRKLMPELRVKIVAFRLGRVINIAKSGVWVSIESINKLLQTGLDLLIANIFVNPAAMGLLSVAKTIPMILSQVSTSVAGVFYPKLTEDYAAGNYDSLMNRFSFAMKFTSFVTSVPLIGFIVFGGDFYALWLPERSVADVSTIQILSVLTVMPLLANTVVEPLYYANTLTNMIKGSVLITLVFSVLSISIEMFLLMSGMLNPLLVIAATSSLLLTVRHLVFCPWYFARILKVEIFPILRTIARLFIGMSALYVLYVMIQSAAPVMSWGQLVVECGLAAVIGYALTFFIDFNRSESLRLLALIKRKLRRR